MRILSCIGLVLITILASCSRNPDSASQGTTPPAGVTSAGASDTVSGGKALDKFALWTDGTQLRGANIYQRIIYPDGFDDPWVWGDGPLGPVYTQEDFDSLSASGANLVVFSHPGLFDDTPPFALNTDVQDNLDRYIGMADKADLFVVIAFRTGPGRNEFSFWGGDQEEAWNEVWKDENEQDKWVEMWRYTAARYRDKPNVVGYELLVEPNSNGPFDIWEPEDFYAAYKNTTYDWNQMYPRISRAIREVDTETPILISSMSWSQVRWLPALIPTGDTRTVYTVHQYEPQEQYTHQWGDETGNLQNRYPGRFDTNWDGVDDDFDKTWIEILMETVDEFKAEYGVPVAVTEYGLLRWEPGGDRFVDDEMTCFEESGVNYAIWVWQPEGNYNAAHNEFNFRLGPDPGNLDNVDSELYSALKKHWSRNTVRPSDYR